MTDVRSWERGVEYFTEGRVHSVVHDGTTVVASVEGQQAYRVRLSWEGGDLLGTCTCPVGRSGAFCKHCVALGLAFIESQVKGASSGTSNEDRQLSGTASLDNLDADVDRLRKHLSQQESSALVDLIIEHALWDENLFRQLELRVAASPGAVDMKVLKHAVSKATRTGGFVNYNAAPDFARGIEEVVRVLSDLLKEKHVEEVITLTEHALRRVERALDSMDDSDGFMRPILDDLQALHHAACVEAKPNPKKLARHLFDWELNGDWDTFFGAAETYADVLGEEGLAEYAARAGALWAKLPQLGPGQEDESYASPRFRLTLIMESLAKGSGDVEALVAVKRRDLSSAFQYLEIAETYEKAGQPDKALTWAEDGIKAFPDDASSLLRSFLAEQYHRLGQHDDALALIWRDFLDHASLDAYQTLKKYADRTTAWPRWREKALAHLRTQEQSDNVSRSRSCQPAGPLRYGSQLVEIFLWEQDVAAAWTEARRNGCSTGQWMRLARLREDEYPKDALRIYHAEVQRLVNLTSNAAYEEAIGVVRAIRGVMERSGCSADEFTRCVEELRTEFKRKRNFVKLLDAL